MTPMRRLLGALLLVLAMGFGAPAPAQSPPEIVGPWQGVLTPRKSTGVTVVLTVSKAPDGSLAAIFSQPYSGINAERPVTAIAVKDGTLTFAIAPANASFEGHWNATAHQWQGDFKQGPVTLPLTLEAGKPPARPAVSGIDGTWQGSIERNGATLRLVVRIGTGAYGTIATLDSPDQLIYGEEIPVVTRNANNIHLANPASPFAYDASLAPDGSAMNGVWKRPGLPDAKVRFARSAAPTPRFATERPQTPKPPFDYRVQDISIDNASAKGVRLGCTLTLPKGSAPAPAAILISGSGPNDRDDSQFGHKPFAVIADHLTRHGIAVLRCDDRGVGASTGDFTAADDVDFASDANSGARYLMSRPEIRHDAVGFIGHSEGGVIAPVAMASNPRIAFLVMLAGPGVRWDKLLLYQRHYLARGRGESEQEIGPDQQKVAAIYTAIANSRSEQAGIKAALPLLTPEAMAAFGTAGQDKLAVAKQLNSRWTRFLFHYDPAINLRKIHVPVLALGGTLDRQIPSAENLPAIKSALVNSRDVTIKALPSLNHMFQTAKTGAPGEYADISETFAPIALDAMTNWINKRFAAR